jgi:hypothetical protein
MRDLAAATTGGRAMPDETAAIKAACIQAAAQAWTCTTLPDECSRDPDQVADRIALLAAQLFRAWKKHEPK